MCAAVGCIGCSSTEYRKEFRLVCICRDVLVFVVHEEAGDDRALECNRKSQEDNNESMSYENI